MLLGWQKLKKVPPVQLKTEQKSNEFNTNWP